MSEQTIRFLSVGSLRQALEGVPDDVQIVVRIQDDDGDMVGGIESAQVEYAHDEEDTPYLAIDCWGGPEVDDEAAAQGKERRP